MEFTQSFGNLADSSASRVSLSPAGGSYLATLQISRELSSQIFISIRETTSLSLLCQISLPKIHIDHKAIKKRLKPQLKTSDMLILALEIIWSPDASKIAVFYSPASWIFIYNLNLHDHTCLHLIKESQILGVARILWLPDSNHILAILDYKVSLSKKFYLHLCVR